MSDIVFFFQAEDGIRDLVRSRGLGDVYKRQHPTWTTDGKKILFHYQINAKDKIPERAYLGYYDLQLKHNGELDLSLIHI